MDAFVARSAEATDSIAGWPEGEIDGLITALSAQIAITALSAQIAAHAEEPAAWAAAETGIGCVPDKADKARRLWGGGWPRSCGMTPGR